MSDPRDPNVNRDPRFGEDRGMFGGPRVSDAELDQPERMPGRAGNSMWAWLAGIVAAVFIIAISYGFSNHSTFTTAFDRNGPATTTGSASPTGGPPAGTGASTIPGTTGPASQRSADPNRSSGGQ